MFYMEFALLPKESLRIKGKRCTFVVDPQDKSTYNAGLALRIAKESLKNQEGAILIYGPGEYEVGGVKMNGVRNEGDMIYSMNVDGIDIPLGRLGSIEKMQQKLKEHHIVIAYDDTAINPSFVTGLATGAVVFYGVNAKEIAVKFGKENIKEMEKYTTTLDKLPQEVETIVLV